MKTVAAVEAGVVMMENPSGPIGGGVVVVVEVGVTKLQGEGRMKLSPANPQLAIGCTFQDQILLIKKQHQELTDPHNHPIRPPLSGRQLVKRQL